MRIPSFLPALGLLALAGSPAHAAVEVTYADPDKFSDASDRNTDPRQVMQILAGHLRTLGDRTLPPGSSLGIEVLDLDRAGRPRMNLPTEIRVVSGTGDMPCLDLRYSLNAAAPVHDRVCDPDFLRPLGFQYDEHDPLVYEKRMLDTWFQRRFGKPAQAR